MAESLKSDSANNCDILIAIETRSALHNLSDYDFFVFIDRLSILINTINNLKVTRVLLGHSKAANRFLASHNRSS